MRVSGLVTPIFGNEKYYLDYNSLEEVEDLTHLGLERAAMNQAPDAQREDASEEDEVDRA